ncbi:MAG: hydrogenase expression protein [Candidatus Tectomicrobia bacterium]|nr:hydrogenase expression protein [Candidatus Tectomicrobia bacterium]
MFTNPRLFPGKLPPDLLALILSAEPVGDSRVLAGPAVGWDAAVLDFGERYLVAKTDPITHATDEIGWFAVHINANDIACLGATPRWFLATLLLPGGSADEALAERIFSDVRRGCRDLGVSLVGGHTEITFGLPRPVVVGAMLGEVERERLVTPKGARAGDALVLTKGIPLEAVAIMARERRRDLERVFGRERVAAAARFLYEPGISVVRDARVACDAVPVHAMHDPTEGGLATAIHELAWATGLGVRVEAESIPVLEEGRLFCEHLGLDPLGAFASGSLLLCVDPADAGRLVDALKETGVPAQAIGEMRAAEEGVAIRRGGREDALPLFTMDEIGKIF